MENLTYRIRTLRSAVALFCLLCLGLGGCSITPATIIKKPESSKAPTPQAGSVTNGAIYNPARFRPLLEDRRPRMVGDIITINITENTSATKAGGNSGSKDGAVDTEVTSLFGYSASRTKFASGTKNKFEDKIAANSSNVFNGSLTTTVIDVLPNGYLVVSGEKQVAFDRGTEFVRFSGVVNPDQITQGNVIASTKVADARIEYRTNSKIDAAEVASMLSRFFLSLGAF
jgi:flagellar L-ring protein precursor FlgH